MKITPKYSIAFLLLFVLVQVRVLGQNNQQQRSHSVVWNGSVDSDYYNPLNWTPNFVPDFDHDQNQDFNHELTIPDSAKNDFIVPNGKKILVNLLHVNNNVIIPGGSEIKALMVDVQGKGVIKTENNINSRSGFTLWQNMTIQNGGKVIFDNTTELWGNRATINVFPGGELILNGHTILNIGDIHNYNKLSLNDNTIIYLHKSLNNELRSTVVMESHSIIEFTGADKHIVKSNGLKYSNVRFKTDGDIVLQDNFTILDEAYFEKGIVKGNTGNEVFTFDNGADYDHHHLPSNLSHVVVKVKRIGSSKFTFPIGDGTNYRPLEISKTSDRQSHEYIAQYFNQPTRNSQFNNPNQNVNAPEYWTINSTDLQKPNVEVYLYANDSNYPQNKRGFLEIIRWNGQEWSTISNRNVLRSLDDGFVHLNQELSDFGTLALHDDELNLPVKLISFKATQNNKEVDLTWATATEINSEKFIVERSYDARHWEVVKEVQGAGNSDVRVDYEVEDHINNTNEKVYYRLTQFDFDGQSETFDMVTVGQNESLDNMVSVFPDPVHRGGDITISTASDEALPVRILSIDGKEMDHFDLDHQMSYRVNTQEHMIFVEIANGSNKVIKKVIVE
ncbi:hypothetical protein MY04_3486 [Flammeovirga sp. MY04]|uniref:hypothetical protein n=1 Tax=Flammeovirga sp. MY04 TaxID=1191459 RepID=UPI000825367C|nr:hypothetical protein [Flammeovirga sp. MY04]ANQ50839.2 hypothetical protein MY04_3486 [Flammeovirga sp. MY04]